MTTFGITGPRDLTLEQERLVADTILLALREAEATEFTSGCAYGVDTIGVVAAERARVPLIRLTLPRVGSDVRARVLPCNRELVRKAIEKNAQYIGARYAFAPDGSYPPLPPTQFIIEHGKPGRVPAEGYLFRDDLTVSRSKILLAFPKRTAEEQRSGTWATIRRGRKAGIEIHYFPLDGSDPWVEEALESLF